MREGGKRRRSRIFGVAEPGSEPAPGTVVRRYENDTEQVMICYDTTASKESHEVPPGYVYEEKVGGDIRIFKKEE